MGLRAYFSNPIINKHTGFDKFKIGLVHYMYRRVVHKIIYRSMPTIYFRGLSIKLFIGVSPLYVSEGCPQNYLSEYVHYLFRMIVHTKIIYRSMFTICIGGLSTKSFIEVCPLFISEGCPQVKQISLFWKRFSYLAQACVRESVRTRGMDWACRHSG